MKEIKKIDIHAHAVVFHDYVPPRPDGIKWINAEELIKIYDKLNVEKGVLLALASPEGMRSTIPSEECKFLSDKYPERFLWFCGVDPRSMDNRVNSDLSHLLNYYKSIGAKGLGELTAKLYADDPKIDHLFSCCEECDMPVIIHVNPGFEYGDYGIVDDLGLPRIEKMLKKHPNLKLIGHSQPFWAEMSADITEETRNIYPTGKVTAGRITELMREYGNLYCDLSAGSGANALMRDPEFSAKFIEEFSDRILYGCDICHPDNTHQYAFDSFLDKMVEDGMISIENYCKIVRENAIKLLRL